MLLFTAAINYWLCLINRWCHGIDENPGQGLIIGNDTGDNMYIKHKVAKSVSPQIFVKIRNCPKRLFRGRGKQIREKT
jgi:hypothetical protein